MPKYKLLEQMIKPANIIEVATYLDIETATRNFNILKTQTDIIGNSRPVLLDVTKESVSLNGTDWIELPSDDKLFRQFAN